MPVRVFVLSSWFRTPQAPFAGSFFLDAAAAVAARGHEVVFIAPRRVGLKHWARMRSAAAPMAIEESGVMVRTQTAPYWTPRHRSRDARAFHHLARRMIADAVKDHGPPDVLHAQSALFAGASAAQFRREGGAPYLVTEHLTRYRLPGLKAYRLAYARQAFARAAIKSAVSPALAQTLRRVLGDAVEPMAVIPNVVDDIFAKSNIRDQAERGTPVFLSMGRLEPAKNIDGLLMAFADVLSQISGARLRIGGSGGLHETLARQARALGIDHAVTFLGALSREAVAQEMAQADALVLSSHIETFGVVVIEALTSGIPVIATACGGPEFLVAPEDGKIVAAGDNAALAEAMTTFCRQPMPKSKARRQRALAKYSAASVGAQIETLLLQAIETKP